MFKMLLMSVLLLGFNLQARETLDKNTLSQLESVLMENDSLHGSFLDYDSGKVESGAKKVVSLIGKIENKELSKLLSFSAKKLSEIKASNSEEANKDVYGMFSLALANVVKKYDVGEKWNVYSCPMVKKSWIQNTSKDDDVKNPYAANMKSCGSKDTAF